MDMLFLNIALFGYMLYFGMALSRQAKRSQTEIVKLNQQQAALLQTIEDMRVQLLNMTFQDNKGALGYVYVLKSDTGHYKIGKTAYPDVRRETFEVKLPIEVEYLILIESHSYHHLEALLHKQYSHKHINGEWFNLSETDLEWLKKFPGNKLNEQAN